VAKLADKHFVIGFLLPALLAFIVLSSTFTCPTYLAKLCSAATSTNPVADLTYLVILVWSLGVLLLALNYIVYRLYEGYLPPTSWLTWKTRRHRQTYKRLRREFKRLQESGHNVEASKLNTKILVS
jgi:hypothetical protein